MFTLKKKSRFKQFKNHETGNGKTQDSHFDKLAANLYSSQMKIVIFLILAFHKLKTSQRKTLFLSHKTSGKPFVGENLSLYRSDLTINISRLCVGVA